MDFHSRGDRTRREGRFTLLLLVVLLTVPIAGAMGVLGLAIASALLAW